MLGSPVWAVLPSAEAAHLRTRNQLSLMTSTSPNKMLGRRSISPVSHAAFNLFSIQCRSTAGSL